MGWGSTHRREASTFTLPPSPGVRWGASVDLRENQAVLALLAAIPANRLAAAALAELLSRRRSGERITEALVRWSAGGLVPVLVT